MVDRARVAVAVLVVVVGVGLFALGQGPGTPGGTVAPNEVPAADVTVTPGDDDPGTVTVRFASAGDWGSPSLTVAWNDSLRVAEGERRLDEPGDSVTLAERAVAGETPVEVTVTATDEGRAVEVYHRTVRV
jgi:hypothetical protein